jgi:hypothetical protein
MGLLDVRERSRPTIVRAEVGDNHLEAVVGHTAAAQRVTDFKL